MLWQNSDCVVIGANQNAFAECNVDKAKQCNVSIARRKTGGGAVWHDMGNINFSFVSPKCVYSEKGNLQIVLNALSSFGLNATFSGRNDLLCEQFKVSGSAYLRGKNACLHHGTLLVNVDKSKLASFLTPSRSKLAKSGVKSVESRVKNLAEINSKITTKVLLTRLYEAFFEKYPNAKLAKLTEILPIEKINAKAQIFKNPQYIFAKKQLGVLTQRGLFEWGTCEIYYSLLGDKIVKDFTIFSDAMQVEILNGISDFFNSKSIQQIQLMLSGYNGDERKILTDILNLMIKE